jgi:selenium metabolism protein YedF
MDFLDLKGKTCPMPVIETKNFLETKEVKTIEILVDNQDAKENVKRFLESKDFAVTIEDREGAYALRGNRGKGGTLNTVTPKVNKDKILVFISGETFGRKSDELGRVLMRSFLYTLGELETKPWRIVFVNTGVHLAAEGSEYLAALWQLEGLGVEVLSCGTCLDYFHLKEKLRAGRISNMFEIVNSFLEATKVIQP